MPKLRRAAILCLLLALSACGANCWPYCNLLTGCDDYSLPLHTPLPAGIG
jgi:hypothetical protein